MSSPPYVGNIGYYHDHFRQTAEEIRRQPKVDRSCNDKCCYVFFIIITLVFVGVGSYYMSQTNFKEAYHNFSKESSQTNSQDYEGSFVQIENLKNSIPIIAGLILFSIVLSLLFLILLIKFPKPMFYGMCILALLTFLAVTVACFIVQAYPMAIIMLLMILIYACVFYCARDKIPEGIILMKVANKFISQRPSIFLAPLFVMIFVILFEVFWLGGIIGVSLMKIEASTKQQIQMQESLRSTTFIFWSLFQIFYSTFFYYCLVFIIATGCAMWYYNIQGFYLFQAIRRIFRFHIGSFTFAAFLVTIVTFARQNAQQQSSQAGGICAICLCCLACCLKIIEDLLEVLNHNAIIVMAVTGQSYIDSAKSTLSLIFQNFSLFFIVDIINGLLRFTGSLLICGITCLLGFFILRSTSQNPDDYTGLIIGLLTLFLASLLISGVVLGMASQALSCIFIFYCFDLKFQSMGYEIAHNIQPEIRTLLNQIHGKGGYNQYSQPNNNYNNYDRGSGQPNHHNSGYPQLNRQPMGPYGYQ